MSWGDGCVNGCPDPDAPDPQLPNLANEATTGLVAAGGWCAPANAIYDALSLNWNTYNATALDGLPLVRTFRPDTPEYEEQRRRHEQQRLEAESIGRMISRHITNVLMAQNRAVEAAWLAAVEVTEETGRIHDVHQHETDRSEFSRWNDTWGTYRFIGLSIEPRDPNILIPPSPALVIHKVEHYSDWDY